MPRTTEVPIRVRSTDVDAQGITNNSRYFQYFEQARLDHLVAIGVMRSGPTTGGASRLFTIAETTCRFKAPTYHRDELVVRTWTGEVRTRSFILEFQIVRTEDQALIAEGVAALVWLDEDNRPTAMDDEVRAALEGSLLP